MSLSLSYGPQLELLLWLGVLSHTLATLWISAVSAVPPATGRGDRLGTKGGRRRAPGLRELLTGRRAVEQLASGGRRGGGGGRAAGDRVERRRATGQLANGVGRRRGGGGPPDALQGFKGSWLWLKGSWLRLSMSDWVRWAPAQGWRGVLIVAGRLIRGRGDFSYGRSEFSFLVLSASYSCCSE